MEIPEKWKDVTHTPDLTVQMIDPHNINISRGILDGVTKVTITDGYYSDTKISGSLETVDDNYIPGSWLRVLIDDEPAATFAVQKVSIKQAPENAKEKTYDLQSVLWMLDEDITGNIYTISANTKCSSVLKNIVKTVCGKSLELMAGFNDGMFNQAVSFERTEAFRNILASICSSTGNELTCSPKGAVAVQRYNAPAQKEISWTIDADDPNGIVLDPGYEDSEETGSAYNRTIVIATSTAGENEQTIMAYSNAPATSSISDNVRGYTRAQVHQISDMNPFNYDRAMQLVNTYAPSDRSQGVQRDATCMYWPVKGGEVIKWVQNNESTKYLVQTVEHDFEAWTSKLTLKKI